MASTADAIRRSPFAADRQHGPFQKPIPILPSSASNSSSAPTPGNAMDVTPQKNSTMGPPISNSSPAAERNCANNTQISGEGGETAINGNGATAIGAAAAAQQPKVVQTAFIHKLYNMLEDQSIQHLISWSNTNESFLMSPSSEFSKVLSSYFKHHNISSFVRQLNMYGFHKVSDVFHTGSPDSPLWEFKHGNNNFKRGDLVGLREIKRRVSRHALIHRESFPAGSKAAAATQPGTPVDTIPDSLEVRLNALEHSLYDMHVRLGRSEDSHATLSSRYQLLLDGLTRCHQWNQDLSGVILGMVPDPNSPLNKDVSSIQRETTRHLELLKTIDESHDPLSTRPYHFNVSSNEPHPPLSPHQIPHDDQRRSSYSSSRGGAFRPSVSQISASPRRYGSMGSGTFAPSYRSHPYAPLTAQAPPPPPPPPPSLQQHLHTQGTIMPSGSSPPINLTRRHTSGDIRLHGWQPQPAHFSPSQPPFAAGPTHSNWPPSPHRPSLGGSDQQLRDQLARYELPRGNAPTASSSLQYQQLQQQQQQQQQYPDSRHGTPPPLSSGPSSGLRMSVGAADSVIGSSSGGQQQRQGSGSASGNESGWSIPSRNPFKPSDSTGPPPVMRRSSMASTVHSLLNPAETAERAEPEEGGSGEDRKRKRVQ